MEHTICSSIFRYLSTIWAQTCLNKAIPAGKSMFLGSILVSECSQVSELARCQQAVQSSQSLHLPNATIDHAYPFSSRSRVGRLHPHPPDAHRSRRTSSSSCHHDNNARLSSIESRRHLYAACVGEWKGREGYLSDWTPVFTLHQITYTEERCLNTVAIETHPYWRHNQIDIS